MKKPNIVYRKDAKSGSVYAYENYPFWDVEKKQSRSKRKYLGKVDPLTGEIMPSQKRKPKKTAKPNIESQVPHPEAALVVEKTLGFLQLSMSLTLAKRLVCILLIVAGLSTSRVAKMVGLCDKSVKKLEKELSEGDINGLFHMGSGGRRGKLADVEEEIVGEISKNNYHSQQQIADMIYENYGIKVSLPVVSRLLKKKNPTVKMRFFARKSESYKAASVLRNRTEPTNGASQEGNRQPVFSGRRPLCDGL